MTSTEAVAIALNRISDTGNGLLLDHPRHRASFDESGLTFSAKTGGPSWHWQLAGTGGDGVPPVLGRDHPNAIEYHRGVLTERYLPRAQSIEQRFIIAEKPASRDDLVIRGRVECDGQLEQYPSGSLWRAADGKVVSLGGVKVFDATGEVLPATMAVTEDSTEITVDGAALAMATYPVTIDPEIGSNDFRVSHSLDDFARRFDAAAPDVAFNSTSNEFLVVWVADGNAGLREQFEFEIIGQRLDATTGAFLGTTQFVISTTFEDGETDEGEPDSPVVAYNSTDDEYLVVWYDGRRQISGQLLDGSDASEIGGDFEISDLSGGTSQRPDVAYSSVRNQYLVVWQASTTEGGLSFGENEIYGQRISNTGAEVGSDDFRISTMGTDGDSAFDAAAPAVAYNADDDLYLVVWESDDDSGGVVNGEFEIFGQLLSGETAAAVGVDDFRISDMGTNGSTGADAAAPDVAYDSTNGQFLVVWHGDDNVAPLASGEMEIFGQFLSGADAQAVGDNDFRISQFGGDDGDPVDYARDASVAFVPGQGSFAVTWTAEEQLADGGGDREVETFAQIIAGASRSAVGVNFRMSDMGSDGDAAYAPQTSAVAADDGSGLLAVWASDDDRFGLLEGEFEIFGQVALATTAGFSQLGSNDFRISEAGNVGDSISDTFVPAVTYNSVDNVYLVVWEQTALGNSGSNEHISANRIDASSGARLHVEDLLVSPNTPGGSGKENFSPAAVYNPTHNEFLIVYAGNDRNDNEFSRIESEIFVRRMEGDTGAFPSDEFRISDMGERGTRDATPNFPACAYNGMNDQYLVVWESDDDLAGLANNEYEIFGQRLNGADAAPLGADDFRISSVGNDGDADRDASRPTVAQAGNTYVVAWHADGGSTDDKTEIYAQRFAADTGLPSTSVVQLSQSGSTNNAALAAENPSVAADPTTGDFLVVWQADKSADGNHQIFGEFLYGGAGTSPDDIQISNTAGFIGINPATGFNPVTGEFVVAWESIPTANSGREEIRAQRLLPGSGDEVGENDFLLSDMGPDGDDAFGAHTPAVGINTSDGSLLTVWSGDDDENGRIDDEFEIFGQLFTSLPEFSITEIVKSGASVTIRFESEEDVDYSLEESPDLQTWTDAEAGQVTGSGGVDELIDPNGAVGTGQRYFRVVRLLD